MLHEVSRGPQGMTALIHLVSLRKISLVLSQISCIASGSALLEDEQKFKVGGCVGAHKISISCTNMSSKCIK
jgi:hypothetical protein